MCHKEGTAEIKITDTGIGIPQNQLDKIFDRFYQVDSSHTREQEGTGIGLSLTKELIELHRGKIEVESEEGKGSTFRLIFPLGKDHLRPEDICEREDEKTCPPLADKDEDDDKDKEKARIPMSGEDKEKNEDEAHSPDGTAARDKDDLRVLLKKNIQKEDLAFEHFEGGSYPTLLIVEDNPDVRKYIKMILGNYYKITEAKDGEEGLDKAFECNPELIISDVMMPKMDGFVMCYKLKTDSRTSHIPIIMLTAKATIQDKINGLEIGADDYIMKPFEAEELKARIKNLIVQRKRLHEHFRQHGLFEIEEKNITPVDQKFLQKAVAIINEHISEPSFGVEALAENMAVSRSLLLKKTEVLIGESPNELIRRIRLNKAANLLKHHSGNISEIALEAGFSNPSYFAEAFNKQFGVSPSQYRSKS